MLQQALEEYASCPFDPELNYNLARIYDSIEQSAAAVSFYLRAAEKTRNKVLAYECLLHLARCFLVQGDRRGTAKGLMKHAISILPYRPEAYHRISVYYENEKDWQNSYMYACMGLANINNNYPPLKNSVQYDGEQGLLFQKGVACWWIGLTHQARLIMRDLKDKYTLTPVYERAVDRNIQNIGYPNEIVPVYYADQAKRFKYPFPGIEKISRNYAQSYQDMFVLAVLEGKEYGTYLELGSAHGIKNSNTALLELNFNWTGLSIDESEEFVADFVNNRKNTVVCADALKVDYTELLHGLSLGPVIDYLQIDLDPPEITLDALYKIPFDEFSFKVITFEHDFYRNGIVRNESRKYLKEKGYILLISDVAFEDTNSFEDWWIHPKLIDSKIISKFKNVSDDPKDPRDFLFN